MIMKIAAILAFVWIFMTAYDVILEWRGFVFDKRTNSYKKRSTRRRRNHEKSETETVVGADRVRRVAD